MVFAPGLERRVAQTKKIAAQTIDTILDLIRLLFLNFHVSSNLQQCHTCDPEIPNFFHNF